MDSNYRKNIISLYQSMRPLNWTNLIEIMLMFPDRVITFPVFKRSEVVQEQYNNINNINNINNAALDLELKSTPTIKLHNVRMKITNNKYRYDLDQNIKHLIIWTDSDISEVVRVLESMGFREFQNYVIFSNSIDIRSIKNRNHYHLLILP